MNMHTLKSPFDPIATSRWRRWSPGDIAVMTLAASIKGCNLRDFDGSDLPVLPELEPIVSALHCYTTLRSPLRGMPDVIRGRALSLFAKQVAAQVQTLRGRGLDLLWRHERLPIGHGFYEITLALAVTRL